jgi:uncharacterized protein (DUF433 family)
MGGSQLDSDGRAEPRVKGVPARRLVRMLASGQSYHDIRRQYPGINRLDIDAAVRWRNATIIPMRVAEGKSLSEIAREFGVSRQAVVAAQERNQRNHQLKEEWGGLIIRTVNIIQRVLHCRTLDALKKKAYSDECLLAMKGIGLKTFREIRRVIPAPIT